MKRSRLLLSTAVLASVLGGLFAAWRLGYVLLPGERVVVVGLYENAPKIYTGPNGRPAGLFVDLVEAMASAEGWRLRYLPCDWAACLRQLEDGYIDLMPDVAFSAERARRFDFHKVSVANSWSQIYAHPDVSVQTLSDLAGKRIALLQGGIQQSFLAQLMAGSEVEYQAVPVSSLDEGYQAVVDGRADAVVTNSFFAARNGHHYRLVETPIVFLPSALYFASTKNANHDLLERVDAHLQRWRRDADSVYFEAMRRTMAVPPDMAVPAWVGWSLFVLVAGMAGLFAISMLLRWQVAQRTRALLASTRELETQRANLEHLVAERTAELRAAKDEAERLTRVKSDFLANMSHEIRTPMNAILGMLYLALKSDMPEALRSQLGKAQGAARSLLGSINDILDISKIEAGRLELEEIEFGLDAVVEQVADAVGYQAEHKGIEFLIRYDPAIPPRLVGDPLRLGQILLNLCSNAVKFTEQGEVELAFRRLEQYEGSLEMHVCVRDTGIGLTEATRARLFEKFSQADETTTRRFGGTGLGLAISKNLVELMGGRIWIEESRPGHGTTVCFSVPLRTPAQAQSLGRELIEQAGPLLAGIRVLVVDDNEVAREIIAETLRFFRLEVAGVASGTAAIERLREPGAAFDLVLMDWRMPGMNGDEATRRIHADPAIAHRPKVVMITAYGREDVIRLAEQSGVDGFLIKPVSPSTLLDTVLSVLGRGSILGETGLARTQPADAGGAAPDGLGGLAGARMLLVEDNDINREFASELLRSEGMVVDEAVNGAEALERVRVRDYDAVLMDIQMPVMDGLEAARRMRALAVGPEGARFARLPIIAMTALAMAQDAEASRAAGMNDHVTKPIAPDRLLAALSRWMARPSGTAEAGAAAAAQTAALAAEETSADRLTQEEACLAALHALEHLNARDGIRRIGGRPDAYLRQLRRFRERYPDAIDELRRLLADHGVQRGAEFCHALRGVTGNIGAQAVYARLQDIDAGLKRGELPTADLLDETAALLAAVMADIDRIAALQEAVAADRDAPSVVPSLSDEAVRGLLARLAYALEYDLGAAEPVLAELRAGVAGTPLEAPIAAIADRVEVFDLDTALAHVNTMLKQASGTPS
ncbi:MAG: response regulator [Rhodocyclaceae bacterium]